MRYLVGYQLREEAAFLQHILKHRERIEEVFFSWGDIPNGRSSALQSEAFYPMEAQQRQLADLRRIADAGIGTNLLLNGNCYGADALARGFYRKIGDTVDFLRERVKLASVTTTSPVIAHFIRENFPETEIRASVNMSIGSVAGMEYVEDLFDSFYLKREYNRDLARLTVCREWCVRHGKKLYLLGNSGCLNDCSAEVFHDNLVAHESEIELRDNAFTFQGQCRTYLSSPEHRADWFSHTNFIRPEDVCLYEGLCDGVKLATRINANPVRVLDAYLNGHYSGNLPELLEPNHAALFYPEVIDNGLIPADFGAHVMRCDKECEACGLCRAVQDSATLKLE